MSQPAVEERLRSLLAAAAAPTEPGELPGEREALADFRAAVHDRSRRLPMRSRVTPLKAAAVACAGVGALLVGGTAAAAAGVLPGAAQETAREMLAELGVVVPGANEHSAGHADQRGASEDAGVTGSESDDLSDLARETEPGTEHGKTVSETASDGKAGGSDELEGSGSEGKGAEVSGLARATDADGRDKGTEISELASEEKAGGDAAGTTDGTETETEIERGGTEQVDGADEGGAQQADGASDGRSTAGTDHRP